MSLFGIKVVELFDPELAKAVEDGFKSVVDALNEIKDKVTGDDKMVVVLEQLQVVLKHQNALSAHTPKAYSSSTNTVEIADFDLDDFKVDKEVLAAKVEEAKYETKDDENHAAHLALAMNYHDATEIKKILSRMSYAEMFAADGGFDQVMGYVLTDEYYKKEVVEAMGLTPSSFYKKVCYEEIGNDIEVLVDGYLWTHLMKKELLLHILNMSFTLGDESGDSLMELAIASKKDGESEPFDKMIVAFKDLFINEKHEIDSKMTSLFISKFDDEVVHDGTDEGDWWTALGDVPITKMNIKLLATLKKYKVGYSV